MVLMHLGSEKVSGTDSLLFGTALRTESRFQAQGTSLINVARAGRMTLGVPTLRVRQRQPTDEP